MKILMISKDANAFVGGSSVRERLKEYGGLFEELHVVVCAKSNFRESRSNVSSDVVVYNSKAKNIFFAFIKSFFTSLSLARKLKGKDNWVSSQDPFETGLMAFVISKIYRLKLQVQIHTDFLSPQFKKESLKNRFRVFLAKRIIARADSIRVVSTRIMDSILFQRVLNFKLKALHVLPIFVDIDSIKNTNPSFNLRDKFPEFKKIILVVARLEKEKNLSLTLHSFQKVLKSLPEAGLIIAGSGREEKWLKNYANYLGINKNVRFIGFVSDIIGAYKTADLTLITSHYEGYSMSIIEALASNCPVISTDVGIAREYGAEIVNYDAGEIAIRILDVLSKPKKMNYMKLITKEEYLKEFKNTFK